MVEAAQNLSDADLGRPVHGLGRVVFEVHADCLAASGENVPELAAAAERRRDAYNCTQEELDATLQCEGQCEELMQALEVRVAAVEEFVAVQCGPASEDAPPPPPCPADEG